MEIRAAVTPPFPRPNLALVGMMGSGKSAVGRWLSERLGCPFRDVDEEIEAAAGRSICQVFEADGERVFRGLERQALQDALQGVGQVVALGGGPLTDRSNRELVKARAHVIWLRARPESIGDRLAAHAVVERPLLRGGPVVDRLRELLAEREIWYAEADWTVDTDDLTVDEVGAAILGHLRSVTGDEEMESA